MIINLIYDAAAQAAPQSFRDGVNAAADMEVIFQAKRLAMGLLWGLATMVMTTPAGSSSTLAASPTIGTAPLAVTFTGTGSGMNEGVMLLDFGDGQKDDSISTIRTFTRKHTYTAAGSYTVQLKSGAYGGQRPSILTAVASVTITVH